MAYTEASVEGLSRQLAETLRWRPHKEWQKEALAQIDPDSDRIVPSSDFDDMKSKGVARWKAMETAVKERGGELDPTTQDARDWFFNNYYDTPAGKPGEEEDSKGRMMPSKRPIWDMKSNYNARPASYSGKTARGEYTTTVDFETGKIIPNQTYALGGPGETYYNPKTGKAERMPTSEILFQQWQMAAGGKGKGMPRLAVKEETVAGDGVPMINAIRTKLDTTNRIKKTDQRDIDFLPSGPLEDCFYAMLAVPNVTASLYLISDHGKDLQISTITMIRVSYRKHITVYFG